MKRVFLDVGAAEGSSIRFFRKNHPESDQFEIHCFEPLPSNVELLGEYRDITIIPAAAWKSNGTSILYQGKKKSGSMYSDKTTGLVSKDNPLEIDTIDLAEYIKSNFTQDDEIWIKINTEGAEYEIIPHLHAEGLIPWFDRMYIKWHGGRKIPSLESVDKVTRALVPESIGLWRKKKILPLVEA
jgi:FkbM family methyltransferase